jgi:hypothetical protein
MTPSEVEAYERMHVQAVERMGEDVILKDLSKLHAEILRAGAPIKEFEEFAVAYAAEMHRLTPDETGCYMRWWAMSVMRALLGATLQ